MADFFVIDKDGGVGRLRVIREVQLELEQIFRLGSRRLLGDDIEHIRMDGSGYEPDESEALFIEPFDLPEDLAAALENPIGSRSLDRNQLEEQGIRGIVGSFLQEDDSWVGFQVRDRGNVLSARGLNLILDRQTYRKLESPGLTVGHQVHAVVTGNRLMFQSMWWARRLFDLTEHFYEATDDELRAFAGRQEFIIDDIDEFLSNRNSWERKRISDRKSVV